MASMAPVRIVPWRCGSLMRQKIVFSLAPSSRAASPSSRGKDDRPGKKKHHVERNVLPADDGDHRAERIGADPPSQSRTRPSRCTALRNALIGPKFRVVDVLEQDAERNARHQQGRK